MWRDSCSMSETVGAGAVSGFAALVGRLRLRIVSGDGYFEVEGPEGEELHPHSVEVEAPAATVGCGGDADWRLAGSSTRGMSRRHLLLQPAGRQWTVLDCSKNGTWELVPERAPELLPPNFPVPVTPGMRLRLGVGLELKLEPVQDLPPGATTTTQDGGRSSRERIADHELEQIARELLAPRRSGSSAIPPIKDLTAEVFISRSKYYRKIDALAELPEVEPLLRGKPRRPGREGRSQDVADALAIAFPYLTAPGLPD